MRQSLFVCAALAALVSFSGCACMGGGVARTPETGAAYCPAERGHLFGWLRCRCARQEQPVAQMAPSGPPTGMVAYPYYTTRGPRDFLAKNPASIGP
ncbi:MAG: hypothetical protein U1E05_17785 [Patescibacteria group bacterium]|nr:hypothetical protein [Patescibacteria group bacterium]